MECFWTRRPFKKFGIKTSLPSFPLKQLEIRTFVEVWNSTFSERTKKGFRLILSELFVEPTTNFGRFRLSGGWVGHRSSVGLGPQAVASSGRWPPWFGGSWLRRGWPTSSFSSVRFRSWFRQGLPQPIIFLNTDFSWFWPLNTCQLDFLVLVQHF